MSPDRPDDLATQANCGRASQFSQQARGHFGAMIESRQSLADQTLKTVRRRGSATTHSTATIRNLTNVEKEGPGSMPGPGSAVWSRLATQWRLPNAGRKMHEQSARDH